MRLARIHPARPVALLALLVLAFAGCARLAEPARDPVTIAALETLALETAALFDDSTVTFDAARLEALDAQAATIRARSVARALARGLDPEEGAPTARYLADYQRQLSLWAQRAAIGPVAPEFLALRRAAIDDALTDALFFEREALDRHH